MTGIRGPGAEAPRPSVLTIRKVLRQLRELLTDDPHTVRAQCVSLEEAGERLRCSPDAVRALVERGELLAMTIGHELHVPRDELEAFVGASKPWTLRIPRTAKPREVLTIILRVLHRSKHPLICAQTARRMSRRFPDEATPDEVLGVLIAATRRR